MAVQTILYLKQKKTDKHIQVSKIAEALKFSPTYLQKVALMLGRYGVLECRRGRIGGVRLQAEVVTLLDIWNATSGELEYIDPTLAIMRKPLKAFADSMRKVVIYKKR